MTPKEKAEELIDQMSMPQNVYQGKQLAKLCALIAVDEIVNTLNFDIEEDVKNSTLLGLIDYWFEVKQEIEKL